MNKTHQELCDENRLLREQLEAAQASINLARLAKRQAMAMAEVFERERDALTVQVDQLRESFHELVGSSDEAKELAGYVLVQECDFDCVIREFEQASSTSAACLKAQWQAVVLESLRTQRCTDMQRLSVEHNRAIGYNRCVEQAHQLAAALRRRAKGGPA